ncbi:MAG: 3-deoxy-7-phosphoheptulonate synthase [uncultured bacterium]|nr:MAG: 3-deoxy-7-phosphoheptulonate synthase [uncultured bacterium]
MKNYKNQIITAKSVADQIKQGSFAICGIMLESNLVAGNQRLENNLTLKYGQSITDECISWEETLPLFTELATAIRQRRLKKCNPC